MLEVEDHHLATSDASDTMNSGTTDWTFMTNCPSSLKTFLLRLQIRRTLKWICLCAACLLLVAETEWSTESLQMRACLKLNKKVLAYTGINAFVWTLELLTLMEMNCNKLARKLQYSSLMFDRFFVRIAVKCQLKLRTKILYKNLSLIHIWRCRRSTLCRSRWSPYH